MPTANKWGNFPGLSLGWTVSNENFLKGNKVLSELKLRFNRIRQGAITQEISEIVGGAAAQN